MTTNSLALLLLVVVAASAGGQTIDIKCDSRGKAQVQAVDANGRPVTLAGRSGPAGDLSNFCAPPSPDFVGQDANELLSKIKLAKPQTDLQRSSSNQSPPGSETWANEG